MNIFVKGILTTLCHWQDTISQDVGNDYSDDDDGDSKGVRDAKISQIFTLLLDISSYSECSSNSCLSPQNDDFLAVEYQFWMLSQQGVHTGIFKEVTYVLFRTIFG